jgi:polyhydroxyalkanoate synthesis regulator protein
MFKPFVPPRGGAAATSEPEKTSEPAPEEDNIDDLRRQMKEMQERLERMSKEPKKEE